MANLLWNRAMAPREVSAVELVLNKVWDVCMSFCGDWMVDTGKGKRWYGSTWQDACAAAQAALDALADKP